MARISITASLSIDESELSESFMLASGPGGQNVNKVASAVQLRFDAYASPALTPEIRARLKQFAGSRLTKDGVLVITAREYRSQERNRAEARTRLIALLARAAIPDKPRRATKPTAASKRRRLNAKSAHSQMKALRNRPRDHD